QSHILPFPTRRSSDLPACQIIINSLLELGYPLSTQQAAIIIELKSLTTPDRYDNPILISLGKMNSFIKRLKELLPSDQYTSELKDRKSTRLNSSHEWI